ncbi:MAG TPA: hypothetical protein VGH81_04140 [Rudaea sp.]|jgi:hypothetical protein
MLESLMLLSALALNATPAEVEKNPLQPLQFLVGHCWAGDFPNGMGKDTHCFEPMYGGKFIRDKHVLKGKQGDYLGETTYAFDPRAKQIVYWYFSSDGDIDSSSVLPVADGFDFPERHLTQPQDLTMRTHWKRVGNDRYIAINEKKTGDGAWQTEWKVEYVRVGASKNPSNGK